MQFFCTMSFNFWCNFFKMFQKITKHCTPLPTRCTLHLPQPLCITLGQGTKENKAHSKGRNLRKGEKKGFRGAPTPPPKKKKKKRGGGRSLPNVFSHPHTPGFLWDFGKQKVKFGSKKAIFGAIWGGFEGFGPCLGISHPTHPHLGVISQKNVFFVWLLP